MKTNQSHHFFEISQFKKLQTFGVCLLLFLWTGSAWTMDQISSQRDTLNLYGGPGVLEGKFEDALGNPDPQGWVPVDHSLNGTGNFGQVWTDLDDADPEVDNHTPQWAFLDDGIIVPGVGPSYCSDGFFCYGPEGFVTNSKGGLLGLGNLLYSSVVSPPIALPEDGGFPVISFDAYLHNNDIIGFTDWVSLKFGIEATADPQGITGWSYYSDDFFHLSMEASYRRMTLGVNSDFMPAGMLWARIRLSAVQMILFFFDIYPTPAPYMDNVRLQWIPGATSSAPVPENLLVAEAFPNPFNPSVTIRWSAPVGMMATVRVHDLLGRQVASLYDDVMSASGGEVVWNGKSDDGIPAPAGLYLCRIVAGGENRIVKLMMVK